MRENKCPDCSWVPVVDATGRRRLEMRWHVPAQADVSSRVQPPA